MRDDVSRYFAIKSYPMIHDIENLMRHLIANFMLITIGREWTKDTLPPDVEKILAGKKNRGGQDQADKDYLDALYKLDFNHLGYILFDWYPNNKNVDDLYSKITKMKHMDELPSLQDHVPESNWNRYFKSIVPCEDSFLKSRWEKLYELRCKIAHNSLYPRSPSAPITPFFLK
ncbi:MAG TPA: hypothetical protein VE954_24320 [Oligoflexus sp.]|uniref:hypothetical protein n=1 Tax=Oligoflexus sp. TaxID=1971216 RepID=UPI002D5E32FB|nr:hypothetical protein [Oligoflexus sp.]HYX36241.1 hypothetical protein [Oligoflexus sp.]